MYFLLARHIRDKEWLVAISEIPTIEEAIEAMRLEAEYDKDYDAPENWEYKVVKDV